MDNDDSTPSEPTDLRELSPQEAPTVNQLVAYNMTRARRARGWTQQQVADRLQKYTGRTWSKASISAAERSWQGGRPRKFDADELLALSVIFDTPLAYFLLPMEEGNRAIFMAQPEDRGGAGAYLAGVPLLLKHILMDRMATEGGSEFFVRAHAAALKYLKVDWRAPVFLEPDMLRPGTPFPPGYRFGDPLEEEDVDWAEVQKGQQRPKEADTLISATTSERPSTGPSAGDIQLLRQIRDFADSAARAAEHALRTAEKADARGAIPGVDRSFTEEEMEQQPKPRDA